MMPFSGQKTTLVVCRLHVHDCPFPAELLTAHTNYNGIVTLNCNTSAVKYRNYTKCRLITNAKSSKKQTWWKLKVADIALCLKERRVV